MAKANNSSIIKLFLGFILGIADIHMAKGAEPEAIFIFGDSTFDVGTNNLLNGTTALANFPYNGIDFPYSLPTGRFSNGYNLADQLAMLFGYEISPRPYLYLIRSSNFSNEILRGVNFASGGSGILDKTGSKLWNRTVSLRDQIEQFGYVCGNITEVKGEKEAGKIVANSLYILSVGSNDILDPFRLKINLTKEQLMPTLQSAYHQHLKNLYDMGARKFGVIAVPPIGCCPYMRALNKSEGGCGGCMGAPNEFARAFYYTLQTLLKNLSSELPEMKYSLANAYKMTSFVLKNYKSFGFNETHKACCGSGEFNGGGFCSQEENANLCDNRGSFLFWDLYHPSQAATNLSALALYYGFNQFVEPISFKQLGELPV